MIWLGVGVGFGVLILWIELAGLVFRDPFSELGDIFLGRVCAWAVGGCRGKKGEERDERE